jgi:hypothetical protein
MESKIENSEKETFWNKTYLKIGKPFQLIKYFLGIIAAFVLFIISF